MFESDPSHHSITTRGPGLGVRVPRVPRVLIPRELAFFAVLAIVLPSLVFAADPPNQRIIRSAASDLVDPCTCRAELRQCVGEASSDLESCLHYAPEPGRDLLCYLRFDVDIRLCLEQPSDCPPALEPWPG